MMNSELNNQQTDWLAQTEEINDIEASQVNGGMSGMNQASPSSSPSMSSEQGAGGQASSGSPEAAAMQPMQPESSSEKMEAAMKSMVDAMSQ